jgi:hypothetical protein
VAVVVGALLCAYLLYVLIPFGIYFAKSIYWHNQVFREDRTQLLAACQQMMINYDTYTNQWRDTSGLATNEKAWDIDSDTRSALPLSIQRIHPHYIVLGTDHINIALHYPLGTSILGYKTDGARPPPQYDGALTPLTNGVWYWNRNLQERSKVSAGTETHADGRHGAGR